MQNSKLVKLSRLTLLSLLLAAPYQLVHAGADGFINPDEITMDVVPAGKPDPVLKKDNNYLVQAEARSEDRPEVDRPEIEVERPEVAREIERPVVERERERPVCPRRS